MATVTNVKLDIQHGGSGTKRKVSVSYKVCFSRCEALAGSVFIERVDLCGDDPVFDSSLQRIRNSCIRAESGCVNRTFSIDVERKVLDEDGDTVILGWNPFGLGAAEDEIFARVKLIPFSPSKVCVDSNVVKGQFGALGKD